MAETEPTPEEELPPGFYLAAADAIARYAYRTALDLRGHPEDYQQKELNKRVSAYGNELLENGITPEEARTILLGWIELVVIGIRTLETNNPAAAQVH